MARNKKQPTFKHNLGRVYMQSMAFLNVTAMTSYNLLAGMKRKGFSHHDIQEYTVGEAYKYVLAYNFHKSLELFLKVVLLDISPKDPCLMPSEHDLCALLKLIRGVNRNVYPILNTCFKSSSSIDVWEHNRQTKDKKHIKIDDLFGFFKHFDKEIESYNHYKGYEKPEETNAVDYSINFAVRPVFALLSLYRKIAIVIDGDAVFLGALSSSKIEKEGKQIQILDYTDKKLW